MTKELRSRIVELEGLLAIETAHKEELASQKEQMDSENASLFEQLNTANLRITELESA